jgi:hypothetical protein
MNGADTLPTVLVVGPMKAGTTWIHDYLAWRGDVGLPDGVKETFFFDRHFDRGIGWYAAHFQRWLGHAGPVVEVAPSLFHHAEAPNRVSATLGPVALVVTSRDPVSRAWSHYMHLRRKGYTNASLAEAISLYPEIIAASRYDAQVRRWRAAMPASAVSILPIEQLIADPASYAERLCVALGLPPRRPPETLGESNAAGLPPSFYLARIGRRAAETLRGKGGYGAVNFAKKLGLKTLFFGSDGGRKLELTEADRALIEAHLAEPDVPA